MESGAERAQSYRKKAEKHAKLARSGQPYIANTHRTIAERLSALWSKLVAKKESPRDGYTGAFGREPRHGTSRRPPTHTNNRFPRRL